MFDHVLAERPPGLERQLRALEQATLSQARRDGVPQHDRTEEKSAVRREERPPSRGDEPEEERAH
jgi:hypothetical protein